MREIKFRAWDEENRRMILFDFSDIREHGYIVIYGDSDCIGDYDLVSPCSEKVKIMQYTGLKDKSGCEIYEGDIVNVLRNDSFAPYRAEVYFASGCFVTCWYNPIDRKEVAVPMYHWDNEVIGNIYENPELLKSE